MGNIIPFRFSVVSDIHRQSLDYSHSINQRKMLYLFLSSVSDEGFFDSNYPDPSANLGGAGDFLITTGDYSYSTYSTIPYEHRELINKYLGTDYRWIPVLGNHDISDGSGAGLTYLRDEWNGDNPGQANRESIRDYAEPGPEGCSSTQYYFFHKGLMFICMNWYWDGTTNTDADKNGYTSTYAGGIINDAQISWLTSLFRQYPRYPKLVFGHGNAFALTDHRNDYDYLGGAGKENRDLFWKLLEDYNGIAYVHGHTHYQRFDYVDDSYSSITTSSTGDSWSYGTSKVAHINAGSMETPTSGSTNGDVSWPDGRGTGSLIVDVSESAITFNFYKITSVDSYVYPTWSLQQSQVIPFNFGGSWYYTQNKAGTIWFDQVNSRNGWTLDFDLTVSDVQNTGNLLEEEKKASGAGIYVNDGSHQEVVNFMSQEIVFKNANTSITYDTTVENDYRLIGKEKQLKLFARPSNSSYYSELGSIPFIQSATNNGNALDPNVFEDANGSVHAVWWDDGNGTGTIYYSKYEHSEYTTSEWSDPEEVVVADFGLRTPSILVDDVQNVYVLYEALQGNDSSVGFVYKNNLGWSDPAYITSGDGRCKYPKMIFDSQFNICVTWEDGRSIYPEIYANIFNTKNLSWRGEKKISASIYGSYRPSIASYMDNIFISWTQNETGNTSEVGYAHSYIHVSLLSSVTFEISSSIVVSTNSHLADHSSIIANVAGRVIVCWHDDVSGSYEIYSSVLSPQLDVITSSMVISAGKGGSRYPVLSEHTTTGYVYITWQDFKDGSYTKFVEPEDYDDPSAAAMTQEREPLNSSLYVAVYQNGEFYSSGNSSFDVSLQFKDDRNCYYPSTPTFFSGELPILYQSYLIDEYYYSDTNRLMSQARCAFYNLSRDSSNFSVNYGTSNGDSNRDWLLNQEYSTKEIRFGDFSNSLNVHYVFKNIKIYTDDAAEPYNAKDLNASLFSLDGLTANDVVVNNYGDVWIVGTCGMFYYINKQNRIISVGPASEILGLDSIKSDSTGDEQSAEIETLKTFKAITFDNHHNMYVGGNDGIRYTLNPVNGFKQLDIADVEKVTALAFDADNNLFVGTQTGLVVLSISESDGVASATNTSSNYSGLPSVWVTSIKMDSNNCIWIGTRNGLYRFYKNRFIKFDTLKGLSSNRINDIAIRNTSVRYIATPNGINKMVGFSIDKVIQSSNVLWNNNVKSLLWKDPNILFAGTMNRLNQIIVDDVEDTYTSSAYTINSSTDSDVNDFQSYYILSDQTISEDDVIEVYINGNLVSYGYDLGMDKTESSENVTARIIRFRTPLQHDDVVEVVVRKDIEIISSFSQTDSEIAQSNQKFLHIQDLGVDESSNPVRLYVVTHGDENEVKINDSNSNLPYDKIHLDTTAPHFETGAAGIKIGDQLSKNIVKVSITGATDATATDDGSGIDRMIISNYENFTTDGSTEQSSVPYSTPTTHDIGSTLDLIVKELTFTEGTGSAINYFSDVNDLFASTSLPAVLYQYNWIDEAWEELYTYDDDRYVDFIEKYNNKLFVSLGHATNSAKIYIYDYVNITTTSHETSFNTFLTISESRAYAAHELDGKLYIGSGVGSGQEYQTGTGLGGMVYVYNDQTTSSVNPSLTPVLADNIDTDVYALSHVGGSKNLLAATGDSGFVYEIDVQNEAASIIYNSDEPLISLSSNTYGSNKYVFSGGSSNGIIRRSLSTSNSFDISFRTTSDPVRSLKVCSVQTGSGSSATTSSLVFASVGKILYYLSSSGSWMWKYTHLEDIEDFAYNGTNQAFYVISSSQITRINPSTQTKTIYLKLIDRAGNESVMATPYDTSPFVDSIEIADLVDFINENRLIEIDSDGNIVSELSNTTGKYYSGDKIEEEKGEYVSEIFDGTNDLVKWQNISWDATESIDTQVLLYVRTSTSRNDILTATWIGPYEDDESSGVDLSSFSGQFMQFKVSLLSTSKGISPSFHSATIRAITAEAIHFFTTNFAMSSRIRSGIITSEKIVPVAADIVFGINTTNSIDWTEYQEVDENRLFNVNQVGENFRVGIKLISPNRSLITPSTFDEYGPYNSLLYVNTVDFDFTNSSGSTNEYHFRVTLYRDVGLNHVLYSASSDDSPDGFSVEGFAIPTEGISIPDGETVNVLFTVPGSANITCGEYYFAKTEVYDTLLESFTTITDDHSFVAGCTSTFVDTIDFDFTNNTASSENYHFEIKFYSDSSRINEYMTVFSGNGTDGWFADDVQIPTSGVSINPGETFNIVYRPTVADFESDKIYYLAIRAHDGENYVIASNSYTFQVRDIQSTEYCGGYSDVPIVKNFGIMVELEENQFVTLNI